MKLDKLKLRIPNHVLDELLIVMKDYNINTINKLSNFLGQVAHESGNFKFISGFFAAHNTSVFCHNLFFYFQNICTKIIRVPKPKQTSVLRVIGSLNKK